MKGISQNKEMHLSFLSPDFSKTLLKQAQKFIHTEFINASL